MEKFNYDECTISYFTDRIFNGFLFLHNHGIAHNNINPHNILVKETEGQSILKITGFASSSTISSDHAWFSKSVLAEVAGSLNFAAPEIRKYIDDWWIWKAKINGLKADICSMGFILIYLVSYVFPLEGIPDWCGWIEYNMRKIKIPWLKTLLENMINENPKERKKIGELIEIKAELIELK